jgi:hypothetical protein
LEHVVEFGGGVAEGVGEGVEGFGNRPAKHIFNWLQRCGSMIRFERRRAWRAVRRCGIGRRNPFGEGI